MSKYFETKLTDFKKFYSAIQMLLHAIFMQIENKIFQILISESKSQNVKCTKCTIHKVLNEIEQ